jgi:hypothetical protein
VKEFTVSTSNEAIQFKIGDDVFTARAASKLPGNVLIRYTETVQAGKLHEAHQTFFARVLEKESADLFAFRLDSSDNPINLQTMTEVAVWLMEQYSNFDTAPAKP